MPEISGLVKLKILPMIVPAMTAKEIHKEVFADLINFHSMLVHYRRDFQKIVLRSSRYPLTKSYVYTTRLKKNTFFLDLTAFKRGDWKYPHVKYYCVYSRPEGKYAVMVAICANEIIIYPPHFFKRYRERIVKDDSMPADDLIRHYFKNDNGFISAVVNKDFEAVFYCYEHCDQNEKVSLVSANGYGYCFGEMEGNIMIMKTIITEDMLFENQKAVFASLKQTYNEASRNGFKNDEDIEWEKVKQFYPPLPIPPMKKR